MLEKLFSLAGAVVLPCWLLLAGGTVVEMDAAAGYVCGSVADCECLRLAAVFAPGSPGRRFQLAGAGGCAVQLAPYALLAGWIHYLAFDLFTGAWEARDAARLGISRWAVGAMPDAHVSVWAAGPIAVSAIEAGHAPQRRRAEVTA